MAEPTTEFKLNDPDMTNSEIASMLGVGVTNGGCYPDGNFSISETWIGRRSGGALYLVQDRPDLHELALQLFAVPAGQARSR